MPLCFGPFTLDLDQRRLLTGEREVPLTPKAFELLKLLIDHRPKALSKDEILQAIWKDTFVAESNLATTIRDLRAALDDNPRDPRFIRTSYSYGYAFVGDVRSEELTAALSGWRIIYANREIPLRTGDNILGRSGSGVISACLLQFTRRRTNKEYPNCSACAVLTQRSERRSRRAVAGRRHLRSS